MSEYIKTLEYYFEDGSHVVFEKYAIDTFGIIKNKESGKLPSYGNKAYNVCGVTDDKGKRRTILVGRAVASTFLGKPPTPLHTADHIESEQKKDDALANIRWLCKTGQANNRIVPKMQKSAFIIVKDSDEKTVKEWVECMNATKSQEEREFTYDMIKKYAQKKQRGFAYKEYPDLPGEDWKPIKGSENDQGHWKISNMNRVKWITKHAENVLWGERLGHSDGYPVVKINGKNCPCHILAFEAFKPTVVRGDMMVLHEDDDKEDFRPHKLYLGTASDNRKDAHDNGKYDGTKSARMKCASYIDGVLEEEHLSLTAAAEYLKKKDYPKASRQGVVMALSGKYKTMYGRTWQKIE
ncbi:hypothetical protein PBCVFr5L_813R [Paramecium bursaria Chlorella virus Fr5L]|nr:hypothetical protein PBCVCZ2_815R [Paramecium bursaria Chlorella virus CZ-2]AGE53332.1 hypothetical protein PBCVFr5L_813R [Paramecium bursaria Chlorella virus Fr5L]